MTFRLLILALLVATPDAGADIYRYLNEEGVICFTDSPTSRRAVKIMREPAIPRKKAPRQRTTVSRPVETAAKNSIPDVAGTADCDLILPVRGRISSTVGLRHDPIDGMLRDHKGVDIAIPEGTPVRPVLPGTVIYSGYRPGYGNTVTVAHDNGLITLYAHNSVNLKTEGEPVDRGSTIAFSGSTGRSTGPHLHFEAWRDGVNITATFIPGGSAVTARDSDGIKRTVQADGTLVFSNLPQ